MLTFVLAREGVPGLSYRVMRDARALGTDKGGQ